MYQDDNRKIKGCIERVIVRRRQEVFKSVLRRGDPTNKLGVTNNKDHVLHNIQNNDELRQKNEQIATLKKILDNTMRSKVSMMRWISLLNLFDFSHLKLKSKLKHAEQTNTKIDWKYTKT